MSLWTTSRPFLLFITWALVACITLFLIMLQSP